MSASGVHWSSDRDGSLGTGLVMDRLASDMSPGMHQIRAKATDSAGHEASAVVQLLVLKYPPARLIEPGFTGDGHITFRLVGTSGTTNVIETPIDLRSWIPATNHVMATDRELIQLERPAGAEPFFLRAVTR